MGDDCIFCKIVAKEIPAEVVYEDDSVIAFLDIHPVNEGHTLVIPKEHHAKMHDTPDELVETVFVRSKMLMNRIKTAMNADFVALSVVGKDVPHFHVHVIPRYSDDGLADFWPTKTYEQGTETEIAETIRTSE